MSPREAGPRSALALPALIALLPFEPRWPLVKLFGAELMLLELAAVVLVPIVAANLCGPSTLRRPPLILLGLFVLAHALSAVLTEVYPDRAWAFVAKMAVAALFAAGVAAAPASARRRGLVALVAATSLVAVLAVLEGLGLRAFDPVLDVFRERPFLVGGARRATAGSSNPNLAAAFLGSGLVALVALGLEGGWPRKALAVLGPLLAAGLLFTYSRGAFGATLAALVVVGLASRRARGAVGQPLAALAVLLGVAGLSAIARPSLRLRVTVESAGLGYGANYTVPAGHRVARPGEALDVPLSVLNTGDVTWTPERFGIAARWYDPTARAESEGPLLKLARAIPPGERLDVVFPVKVPGREGRLVLVLDLYERSRGLFSTYGVGPALLPVSVAREGAPPPFAFAPDEDVWRRGRFELWRIALLMWRDHPIVGAGPDAFRWRHAERGGWLVVGDFHRSADSTYLELLASTGTLGLLTYVATLVLASRAAWRGQGSGGSLASAALGLLVVATVHGLVEYVLRFSGPLLLFGFTVGLASGALRDAEAVEAETS